MRWTRVCPLLGVVLFACATEENDFPSPSSLTTGADNAGGSAGFGGSGGAEGGGSSGSGVGGGSSGTFGTSGASASGTSAGGTFGASGSTSLGGTFGTAGSAGAAGGGGKAAAGAGGSGGAGGGAGGSGGAGGKASGGAGGKANGGGNTQCGTIPAKSTWKGSALRATDPVTNAFDGNNATRFTTGMAQMGDEWIEIDFGKQVTINQVTMLTPSDDYSRHYQLLLSNTSKDPAATLLKEGDGMNGTSTVSLPQTHSGQFLTIRQTGKVTPNWWSIYEVSVDCK